MPVTFVRVVFATFLICLLGLGTTRTADATGIYISHVEGTYEPGKLTPGGTIKIYLALDNDPGDPPPDDAVGGTTVGFEISQTGGASWGDVSLEWSPEFLSTSFGFWVQQLPIYDQDSTPPDTVAIELGLGIVGTGFPAGFNEDIAILTINQITGPLGATVTIDSVSSYGPAALDWTLYNAVSGIIDDDEFVGATIELDECCVGTTGNVTGGEDVVSLTDFSILRNHLFITFEELPCWKEANVDASPDGVINLTDITKLVNHLFVTFEPLPACP